MVSTIEGRPAIQLLTCEFWGLADLSGDLQAAVSLARGASEVAHRPLIKADGGIALIELRGILSKSPTNRGDSTVLVAMAIRSAMKDPAIKGILLVVDSAGGTIAGASELAREISDATKIKPIHVFCEDMTAGTAYWAASQASYISASSSALIGGIGVSTVKVDTSEAMKSRGITVHAIATGKHKGAGLPGTKITDAHLAKSLEVVDTLGKLFSGDVARGRTLTAKQLAAVTDGGLYIAANAEDKRLIDSVQSIDAAYAGLAKQLGIEIRSSGRGVSPFMQ